MGPWDYLGLFLIGISLYIMFSKGITFLEARNEYGGPLYNGFLSVATFGLMLAVWAQLKLHVHVKALLNSCEYKAENGE